jgi:glycosyltransferase involved in cell wall biosynthesis
VYLSHGYFAAGRPADRPIPRVWKTYLMFSRTLVQSAKRFVCGFRAVSQAVQAVHGLTLQVSRLPRVLALYHRAETFGGSFNSVLDVLGRADRSRFEPTVALPGEGNCARQFRAQDIDVVFMAERSGSRTVGFVTEVAACAWRLRRWRVDLVYVTDYVTWRSSLLAGARLAGVPSVVHVRSPLATTPIDPELWHATIVVGNSEACVRSLRAHKPADRVRVVYNFIDFERFAAARDLRETFFGGRPPVVGFVGVFRPEKGIEYFLEMAHRLHARRPDVRFLAVGGESAVEDIGWFPKMQQYADSLGLRRVIRFTGSRTDIPDVMRSLDVLVVPSLNEGFGRVILEANAVGVCAVGADAAGIPEVIEHGVTGFLVPPQDPDALAAAVERVLDDAVLRERFARELPGLVRRRFSPETQMRTLQEAWADAIAENHRPA